MDKGGRKVAILGGGMAGLSAAWRLSEPGWREEFESITVYQRGWRLGGKGASSRGRNGRIEEHGLHVWLGWYENAFRLLRQCYEELDRPARRPNAPIQTLSEALIPSGAIGMADRSDGAWSPWVTTFPGDNRRPGDPGADGRELSVPRLAAQAFHLLDNYFDSLGGNTATTDRTTAYAAGIPVAATALGVEVLRLLGDRSTGVTPAAVAGVGSLGRTWRGIALAVAALRGIALDRLLTDPHQLAAINDEEYLDWLRRHGAPHGVEDYSIVRSLYDMVFGFVDGDTSRPSFSAGTAVLFGGKTLFDYKGSIFWKMGAGMGDVVFAPLYEALSQRGVQFEFFHRVDSLHPSEDDMRIDTVVIGRQARLAGGRTTYEPLILCKDLPCFPASPRTEQLEGAEGIAGQPLESHWCEWPDAERRVLRDGVDFDLLIFAIPPGMGRLTCKELAASRPEWREMLDGIGTVATQSFQIWLSESDADLGWPRPGSTLSAFAQPFNTWASMPHLIDVEDWPSQDKPGGIAYFCGPLQASVPSSVAEAERESDRVRRAAISFVDRDLRHLLPKAANSGGFRWEILCGGEGRGPGRFGSQYWSANIDASDRYSQSLPGTDQLRLRSDESGYDNLVLAGDWTDSGLNVGCIEAAVVSGLQAANAIGRRHRLHEIAGYFMP